MARRVAKRMWSRALSDEEKAAIAERCERFIREEFKPRFLPQVRATSSNYPVGIFGKWRATQYSFVQLYRFGFADTLGEECSMPFTRLDLRGDCLTEARFDVMWHRHNGQWWPLYRSLTLDEALERVRVDGRLQPIQ